MRPPTTSLPVGTRASEGPVAAGLTRTGSVLVIAITLLSVGHHIDHVVRDVTGWPLGGGFNPFSASLFVYPVIVAGLLLSRSRRVGARFWAVLAGSAALLVAAVHVGPAAGDAVTDIPEQHSSSPADVLAVTLLVGLLGSLVAHCAYEWRRLARERSER